MSLKITKQELKTRIGFILLGFFSFYLVSPLQKFVESNLKLNNWVIGIGGIIITLLVFDF